MTQWQLNRMQELNLLLYGTSHESQEVQDNPILFNRLQRELGELEARQMASRLLGGESVPSVEEVADARREIITLLENYGWLPEKARQKAGELI